MKTKQFTNIKPFLCLCMITTLFFGVLFIGQNTAMKKIAAKECNFSNGLFILIDQHSHLESMIQSNDIVLYKENILPFSLTAKRVIGFPNETIQNPKDESTFITLKENEYFVMGDKSQETEIIEKDRICGKILER